MLPLTPPESTLLEVATCGGIFVDSLRSAHARRPICTLRIYTFLVLLLLALPAPCECSHPGRDPTPQNPTPRDPPGTPQGRGGGGEGPFGPPWAPSGPRGDRLYATKIIPNGIHTRGRNCTSNSKIEGTRVTLTNSWGRCFQLCGNESKKHPLLVPTFNYEARPDAFLVDYTSSESSWPSCQNG